jgi:hypothetical protein
MYYIEKLNAQIAQYANLAHDERVVMVFVTVNKVRNELLEEMKRETSSYRYELELNVLKDELNDRYFNALNDFNALA